MNITFIGGGNMADALIGGLLGKDPPNFKPANIRASDVSADARRKLEGKYGIRCFEHAHSNIRDDDVVVFAVKPQQIREAAQSSGLAPNANLVISIAAGVRLVTLSQRLGGHTRLVRCMPNTPALIGAGITGLYPMSEAVTPQDKECAEMIMSAVGGVVWIRDEQQMDAVTAVSGSGPAYVFLFIEALEEAACELGLPRETAHQLALQTFSGAARLAAESRDPVAVLRERVTSKGGTTEAALKSMAKDRVKEAIIRAIKAANERGRELGEELSNTD